MRFSKLKLSLIFVLGVQLSFSAKKAEKVEFVYSTPTNRWVEPKKPVLEIGKVGVKPDIIIYSDSILQEVEGIGGAFNELGWTALKSISETESAKVCDALFGANGANFSMGRMPIGASDYALSYYSFDDVPEDFTMRDFNIDRDRFIMIPYIKEAFKRRPDFVLWGSPWTPPAWMKVNEHYSLRAGNMEGREGGNEMEMGKQIRNSATAFKMQERYLQAYALYFSKYIKAYAKEGLKVSAVMPQNEILYAPNWPACTWMAEDMMFFIGKFMGPQFEKDSLKTDIWLGTINNPKPSYVETILNDKESKKYIKGVGFQWNGSKSIPTITKEYPNLKMMQTENVCGEGENNWSSVQVSWKSLVHYFNNRVSSYVYWNMILDETGKSAWGWPQNSLVVIDKNTKAVKYTDEFYLFKHLSHYVQPGDHFLKSSEGENHLAFKLKDGRKLVLINNPEETVKTINLLIGTKTVSVQIEPTSINTIVVD